MLNRRTFASGLATAALMGRASAADPRVIDNEAIRDLLRRRIDAEKRAIGMSVAVIDARRRFVSWGRQGIRDERSITPDTVFEIGSISKVFAALLMANMARRGELAFDDPVARHLPGDFKLPDLEGRPITLADLATHFSGLPRMPPFPDANSPLAWRDAMAQFTAAQFKAWLADVTLERHPEANGWWYSNAGYALLGLALAHRGGRSYESLLQARILDVIGLEDTVHRPPASMGRRVAKGHDPRLEPAPSLEGGLFNPAGGLRSTARDLARFAAAILPGSGARIQPDAGLLLSIRRTVPSLGGEQALGWEVREAAGGSFVAKDGVTFGYAASVVFDPGKRMAIIVLSNTHPDLRYSHLSSGGVGAADIAHHLLRPQIPMDGQGGAKY